jgi:hypothetical protein
MPLMEVPLALAIARSVAAFEAPGNETRSARRLRKRVSKSQPQRVKTLSVSVHDADVFSFLQFLSSDRGRRALPDAWRQLAQWLYIHTTGLPIMSRQAMDDWAMHRVGIYDLLLPPTTSLDPPLALALVTFRPQPLLPLSLASARRAVTFTHGVVALVTANAYISTLGGGHFLCLHLAQAKQMARLQIALADALGDPVLKSKCRVNLAYNAMREGRFRRAQRILRQEARVATQLANDELTSVGIAAVVYLRKTVQLHQEFQRRRADLTTGSDRALVDNFYRQRILRSAH